MQNVVDVACSSPPVMMNATKLAAQDVQAGEQGPFDLVLKKAAERIDNDKQSHSASKCCNSKPIGKSHGLESTANEKVIKNKQEGDVKKTEKSEKQEKSEILSKTDYSEETEKDALVDPNAMVLGYVSPAVTAAENARINPVIESETSNNIVFVDPNAMVLGYVSPAVTAAENAKINPVIESETSNDVSEDDFQPVNLVKVTSNTVVKEEIEALETKTASNQTSTVGAKATTEETHDAQVDPEVQIAFSETLNNGAKVGKKTSTDLKPVTRDSKEKMSESGKVNVSTGTDSQGEEVISIAKNYQEAVPKTVTTAEKALKPAEIETSTHSSPPDNPVETTAASSASATVQNTTQISEPARLAEAPKNEVVTQVANQIDQMIKTNRSSIRLQLYPEELGHIDLRIVTTKDGIGVTMVTDKASTQQALKSEIDSLRLSIEQAGIQLSNLNINQGHNSHKQQSFEHRQNFSNGSYPGSNSDNSNSTSEEPRVHLNSTAVDYRV